MESRSYVCWFSSAFRQRCYRLANKLLKVKLSSTEAEIAAGCRGGKRAVYARQLIGEIFPMERLPISHVVDNSATPALAENQGTSAKSEHFLRSLHYLRWLVLHGFTFIHLCRTFEMHANALTKVESRDAFYAFRKLLMNLGHAQRR